MAFLIVFMHRVSKDSARRSMCVFLLFELVCESDHMHFGNFFFFLNSVFLQSHICWMMFTEKWMEAAFKSKTKPIVSFKSKTSFFSSLLH